MTTPAPLLLDVSGFDRSPTLSQEEQDALVSLGWQLRRLRGYDPALPQWNVINRLLIPLDAARLALRDRPDILLHRRSGLDAVGLVLFRCAEEGKAFWGWPEEAWIRLIGKDRRAFVRPWPNWVKQSVRPCTAAYGYLLCDFDAFHRLGSFNRLALAERVFGREAIGAALAAVYSTLEGWGYRQTSNDDRLRAVFVQALLVNRSTRLEDLTSEALERLYNDPRIGWRRSTFHSVCRAVAAMGFASPPTRCNKSRPMAVQGAPADWIAWVERWCNTSTLTPVVRRMHRSILAMAGRWLTAEQPAINSPADWTRETCAAWVACVARSCIGDYTAPCWAHQPDRSPPRSGHHRRVRRRDPDVFSRLPGMGLVRAALRSQDRTGHSAQRPQLARP